jgi:ankyrin repeat protein
VRFNAIDCVRLFVEHRASVDRQNASGHTPLHCLAVSQPMIGESLQANDAIARVLLDAAKERSPSFLRRYLQIDNEDQQTALSLACEHDRLHLVRLLLLYGASVDDFTPIHMAVKSGSISIVELLLEHSGPSALANPSGETPLHIACKYNRADLLQVLIEIGSTSIDLQARDHQGSTPLLTASYFNHRDCIRILLVNGADMKATDHHGRHVRKYRFHSH